MSEENRESSDGCCRGKKWSFKKDHFCIMFASLLRLVLSFSKDVKHNDLWSLWVVAIIAIIKEFPYHITHLHQNPKKRMFTKTQSRWLSMWISDFHCAGCRKSENERCTSFVVYLVVLQSLNAWTVEMNHNGINLSGN